MYDPRPNILELFTNGKISGSADYGTDFVELDLAERRPDYWTDSSVIVGVARSDIDRIRGQETIS